MKKIGVTGTRSGCSENQLARLHLFLCAYVVNHGPTELHHGDCVGADAETAQIARSYGYKIVCHPPSNNSLRAFEEYDETRKPKEYFERNRDIVNETDLLFVLPKQNTPRNHGGTWYTYNYAQHVGKKAVIIWPDGSVGK